MFVGIAEDNPSYGPVLSEVESHQSRTNDYEDVKHADTVLKEADKEILLLENLLEKSESNCELEPQVNELCFNSFDEEMRFLEECIGRYAVVKDSISLDRKMGM